MSPIESRTWELACIDDTPRSRFMAKLSQPRGGGITIGVTPAIDPNSDPHALIARARPLFDAGDYTAVVAAIDEYLYGSGRPARGIQFLRGLTYMRLGRTHEAFHAMEAELAIDPDNKLAQQHLDALFSIVPKGSREPTERPWSTGL